MKVFSLIDCSSVKRPQTLTVYEDDSPIFAKKSSLKIFNVYPGIACINAF